MKNSTIGIGIAGVILGATLLSNATEQTTSSTEAAPAPRPVAVSVPEPVEVATPDPVEDDATASCWTDCSTEDRYITAYRAKSEDFDTPDAALIDVSGQVCVAIKNRPNDEVHEDLMDLRGLSQKQADGLLYASKFCRALGW
jgi:hypothetical protein